MQESVTEHPGDSSVLVQYFPNHQTLGIGIEPSSVVPEQHFIDAIYGSSQDKIGKIFRARFEEDFGYKFSDTLVDDDTLGRMMLDAVTGSTEDTRLFTSLSRGSVNRLIRILRKARDVTFGKDE